MAITTELIRRGATLLKEPCPKCGGLQVRYRNRVYCVNEDDLSEIGKTPLTGVEEASASLRELVLSKIQGVSSQLEKESDIERQTEMAELLIRYMELIDKMAKAAVETRKQ